MEKYRAGIVGLSGIGASPPFSGDSALGPLWPHSHGASYAVLPDTEVVAVCDLNEELLERFRTDFRSKWPEVRTYTDYMKMLEVENIDLLSVVTSDDRHAQIVVDAAFRGVRGILCEKPIATSLTDADRMIDACESNGVVMSINHSRRFKPHWDAALREFKDGSLGAVRRIVGTSGGPRAMLFRNGTHLIDTICWFAGGEPEWVVGVLDEGHQEYGPRYVGDGGHDPALDPGGSGLVHFNNGVRAFVNMSKRTTSGLELDVFSESGRIRVNDVSANVCVPVPNTKPRSLSQRVLPVPITQRADTAAAIADIIEAIVQGRQTISPPREARKALSIILAMLESQASGNIPVRLPMLDA